MSTSPTMPYVVGQWVRGERFYGRTALIAEILDGPRNCLWLLGTRRIGKTSLLKQLEHLTSHNGRGYFPLFWDFQGAEDAAGLALDFKDALYDAEDRLGTLGIGVEEVEDDDLFASLGRLRRRFRAQGLVLLLLCDEAEELLHLREKDPALLRRLHRAMQSQEGIRSVLASSMRLWALSKAREATSPFLHGFTPPLYIKALDDAEASSLIRQTQLVPELRPAVDGEVVEELRRRCDNHPYLLQLVAKRFLELGDLEEACEQVASDSMVSYFFSVDFEMLSPSEHLVLSVLNVEKEASTETIETRLESSSGSATGALQRLENLGFVRRRGQERTFRITNIFFRHWLETVTLPETPAPLGRNRGGRVFPPDSPPGGRVFPPDSPPGGRVFPPDSPPGGRVFPPDSPPGDRVFPPDSPPGDHGQESTRRELEPTLSYEVQFAEVDDRYRLLEEAGRGANGVVFRAYDTLLESEIAVKLLNRGTPPLGGGMERVRREILLARDIAHPNILRVYHLGTFHNQVYLTMQWIGGPTLAKVIAKEAPMGPAASLPLMAKLASALAAAHGHGVLHRDIKPGNVLLDANREPYLADFGLARLLDQPGFTAEGVYLGTPYYASPEQAALGPVDERSDIYALGVVLFEMATGRRPFEAESGLEVLELQRTAPAPDPRDVEPAVPAPLAQLILRCLEKDAAQRPADAGALEEELRAVPCA